MKYKTSDLSRMLDVSANTIRRFAEKGYLTPGRDEKNQYRYFGDVDVEKVTYISKYRKIGFGHEEIATMLNSDMAANRVMYEKKMAELDAEIEHLQSLRHMVKDDVNMMKGIEEYGENFIEMNSVPMYYICYKRDEVIESSAASQKVLHRFIYDFPEIEYVYIIRKEDILNRVVRCEEAVGIRAQLVEKKQISLSEKEAEYYPKRQSVLRFVRLPLDFAGCRNEELEEVKRVLFDNYLQYMEDNGLVLDGDAIGVKIGFSKEQDKEVQYVILGMPVVKKTD